MSNKKETMNAPARPPRPRAKKGTMGRLIKMLFAEYRGMMITIMCCILVMAVINVAPSVYIEAVASLITDATAEIAAGNMTEPSQWQAIFAAYAPRLTKTMLTMLCVYVCGLILTTVYNQLLAVMGQGFLNRMRKKMFNGMQNLPIRYFDTHSHGDIMSYYTNDIDTLRQLITQSLPNLFSAALTLTVLLCIMMYFSVWMMCVVLVGAIAMILVTKTVGGNSAKFFVRQQKSIGKVEGYIEEMMNGQKVVKVFCHEKAAEEDFDRLNEQLFEDANSANRYANILMPIMGNIGNIMYVLAAFIGGILLITGVPNLSISNLVAGSNVLNISVVVTFLGMTRQFCQNVSQVSQQVNAVVMAMAGASRIFELIDQEPEVDDGYVTLVNAREDKDGNITECTERTGMWAWKHPHAADGSVTYTKLTGDVRLTEVDFGYVPEKIVLHDISLYAEPGQKVAFVGATGAGKTTITNLINRFYDITDGKVRYDGININKIKKADLRRSLGIVLQDVNLFTGTVMDNIRYGKLDATDEECIAAAKLSNAHDFITRLPEGYNTMLTGNGASLSQGQRQLLSIARAAVADPPVMIMDEATSSIDTRTEAIVQQGMDALMKDRTVFVIAHRLSTVRNSDVIMVLDHGRIIERGSHDKLIAEKGKYYQLYTGAFELE